MNTHSTSNVLNSQGAQEIPVRFGVGDRITIYEDVDKEHDDTGKFVGSSSSIMFEGVVKTMNPKTGLIQFEQDSRSEDIGRAQLLNYLETCEGVEVLHRNSETTEE